MRDLVAGSILLALGCSAGPQGGAPSGPSAPQVDPPFVAAQPGAWFDGSGNLTVVGPGKRLRLVLSAPISACVAAFGAAGSPEQISARASLPFHVLREACREDHPSILLAEESHTASPGELERSYHEVARCAGAALTLTEGWRPDVVDGADPCPLALGLGWHLPTIQELSGLGLEDRKALAGALFDTEVPGAFGSLLLYAKGKEGELTLATLSPNASEQAPPLSAQKRDQPLFGASVRCVRGSVGKAPPVPVLPHAAACLSEQRKAKSALAGPGAAPPADLLKLRSWLGLAERQPTLLRSSAQLTELEQLLGSSSLERLAREQNEERALTERYAELAEAVDDPAVSAAERQRRQEEFAHLRRRLGGQIVASAAGANSGRSHLGVVLSRLRVLVESAAAAERAQKKRPHLDYEPILQRLRALGADAAP